MNFGSRHRNEYLCFVGNIAKQNKLCRVRIQSVKHKTSFVLFQQIYDKLQISFKINFA
jgi:hypothetical protein